MAFSPEDLVEASGRAYTARWADSANRLMERHVESQTYPSEANMQLLGEKVIELSLMDEPSVESLEAAYAALLRENALAANSETEFAAQIAQAKDSAEVQRISQEHFNTPGLTYSRF